jgi:peptide/nickel transport system substrate-binding protein
MLRRHYWLVAFGALAVAVALAGTAAAGSQKPGASRAVKAKAGGTLLFGAEQEPPCLNSNFLNDCNNTWAFYVQEQVLLSAFNTLPDFSYVPQLITRARIQLNPERVTYYINPKAKWNDGVPVSGNDFVFTWRTIMNKSWDAKPTGGGIVTRVGYQNITAAKVSGGGKVVTFTFKPNFADWKDLFGTVLPAHALQGTDFSKDFINDFKNPKNGKEISDGPFLFQSWEKGSQLTMVRNPSYWGPHKAYLNKLIFRFLTDSNTELQQVRGGEVDAIYPQPQLPLAALRQAPGLHVQSSLGAQYEHIDIEQGPKGNPLAKNPWVRQALMMSINRPAILKTLFATLNPSLKPLDNVIYLNNQATYVPHFSKWNYNPTKAANLLKAHGCTKGGDGIYSCGGQKLSFAFESTAGNQLRELAFQIIQQQAKANGIELTNNFKPSNVAFGQDLSAGNYQLFMFAWVGTPDPSPNTAIWSCPNDGGTQNFMGYCNARATALMKKADLSLNPKARVSLENQADALIADDVPSVPLYQKPTFLVYHTYVKGMQDNATNVGPFYDSENWWLNK